MTRLAVIGGSGFADMGCLEARDSGTIETRYGPTSGPVVHGRIGAADVLFLPRHGPEHSIPPHLINYRANLAALADAGVERVVALGAVGGIGDDYGPGRLCVPDQIIDYTYGREHTIYDGTRPGVDHIDFTRPYCQPLRESLLAAGARAGIALADGGTHAVTQGPRLESAAEVIRLERDGCHLVGMTGMPEAALARELGLCYAALLFVVNWAAGKQGTTEIRHADMEAMVSHCREQVERVLVNLADTGDA